MNRKHHARCGAALPVVLLLLLIAPARAARGVETPASAPPPPGRLVDAGGHRLHLYCTGAGSQTVVLVAGLGDYSVDWGLVQPRVARFTRVCSYDRAGYAWSDPDPQPRSLQRAVDELQALLTNAEVPGPYLLVGHSWGGHVARVFAAQHRDLVAGMVLVDSSHEDRLEVINGQAVRPRRLSRQELEALFDAEMAAMHAGGAPGGPPGGAPGPDPAPGPSSGSASAPAPTPRPIEPPYDRLPADLQALHLWARSKGRVAEVSDYQEPLLLVGATRSADTPPLDDLPLVVLTRGRSEMEDEQGVPATRLDEDRRRLQADLATLSRRGRQIIAARSGHHIQLDRPRLVARAMRDVVEQARRP